MKTLIVGGTGMIGYHVADLLAANGHDVVIGARRPPGADSPAARWPTLLGDYAEGDFTEAELKPFDAVVFGAGQDVRHTDNDKQDAEYWAKYQTEGVPDFFARAKRAGVPRAVQIGSYYHMFDPAIADRVPYARARQLADERSRELADADFNVSTLNASTVVGPGQRNIARLIAWARGDLIGQIPDFAPPGTTNFVSVRSVAEAVLGALTMAESGKAYLVGDENYTWLEYFGLVFDLVGSGRSLEERDESHPFVYEKIVPRGSAVAFDSTPAAEALGYRLNDVRNALDAAIADFTTRPENYDSLPSQTMEAAHAGLRPKPSE